MTTIPDLLTISQAALQLGVSRTRVKQLIQDGRLEAHFVGSLSLLPVATVQAYAQSRRPRPHAPDLTS